MRRTPCRIWPGALNSDGYPVVRIGGRLHLVHRVAYRLHKGPIPRGKEIHHECCRRDCYEPRHLKAITHRTNVRLAMQGR